MKPIDLLKRVQKIRSSSKPDLGTDKPGNSNLARIEELTLQLTHLEYRREALLSSTLAKLQEHVRIRDEVVRILATVPDDEVYADILELALGATTSRFGAFGYINAQEDWICPSMTRDVWQRCEMTEKTVAFPKEQWTTMPTWGQVYKTHQTVLVNAPIVTPEGHIDIKRIMIIPLLFLGKLVGMIAVANKPDGYTDDDRTVLESVAAQIAPVLSARLRLEGRRDDGY